MFVFSKVIDQLISAILLELNFIIDTSRDLSEANYLLNNLVKAVSVSLKVGLSPSKNFLFYFLH